MAEKLALISERVDDIPLLLAQIERMGLQPLLDEHFPTHGNWLGLSLGWVTVIWLTHIVDSTTASGYWTVTEDGLFQFGHSKDHRPDLPQVKVMLSALDPLGLPVATEVVPGQRADDPLYVPAITRVRESLGRRRLLYVGDCKMGALATRAFIHAGGDYYLCPLSELQVP